ncbi:MAG: hypothetical protein ACOYIF_12400 [Acetivibrionales bacterium]|jgi:uncharacterized protein YukE
MSEGKLVFNPGHMDVISSKYKLCAELAGSIEDELTKARKSLLNNYQGQANDMVFDLVDKIKEHLELLRYCYLQMESYVTNSKETMFSLDKSLASEIDQVVR